MFDLIIIIFSFFQGPLVISVLELTLRCSQRSAWPSFRNIICEGNVLDGSGSITSFFPQLSMVELRYFIIIIIIIRDMVNGGNFSRSWFSFSLSPLVEEVERLRLSQLGLW